MKIKKMLMIAVGVGLCVGGETWGEKYTVKYVEFASTLKGRHAHPNLSLYDTEAVHTVLLVSKDDTQKPTKISWITTEIDADLTNLDNAMISMQDERDHYEGKRVILRKMVDQNIVYVIFGRDALQSPISFITIEQQFVIINPAHNFLRDNLCKQITCDNTLVDFLYRTENNDTYIDIAIDGALDLVVAAIKKTGENVPAANNWKSHKALRKKGLEKKEPEKPADDPKKEGEGGADEPETEMVKSIPVTVNPNGDVFFVLSTSLENPVETVIVLTGTVKVPKTFIEDIKKIALFEPSKTDDFYYSYFATNPKNPIPQEALIHDLNSTPNLVGYFIKSSTIPKLTELTGGNYSIPDLTNLHVTEIDAKGIEQQEKPSYKKSSLKDKQLFIDGKIVKWLNQEDHLEMIKNAAIKKFTEAAALDNLTNTLYQLALPAK